jgi:hypothetical protein
MADTNKAWTGKQRSGQVTTVERQAAQDIAKRTFAAQLSENTRKERIRRGDTVIVRDAIEHPDGTRTLLLVTEDALRDIATKLLVD